MDFKEILLAGGVIKFSYKEKPKEWLGEAYMHVFIFYSKPKVISNVPTIKLAPGGRKEYPIEKIDEAIEEFQSLVFSKKNLAYKLLEAQMKLAEEGIYVDLDNVEDYKKVRKVQLKLQKQSLGATDSIEIS